MKKLIWLPIAGFLLIAGAAAAVAAPGLLYSATGVNIAASPAPSADPATGPGVEGHMVGDGLLGQVLADLVSKGTITQAQSDAITSGLQQAIDDKRAHVEARMQLIKGFVADGVITQDEIDQLPADDPLRMAFDSIADNGQINVDQLRGLGPGFGPGFGRGLGPGGQHGGPGFWPAPNHDDTNPSASPSPSSSSTNS